MYRFACVTSALMMVAGTPAVAQTAPAQPTASKEIASTDSSDVNRVVCRKEEQIGSRLGAKKLCLTVREWRERAELNRDETESVQRRASVRPGG